MSNNKDFSLKRKKENFYKKAKKDNIRARSYFKLEQVDTKFEITKNKEYILDLGSAPGAWLQYLDRKTNAIKIYGIDLLHIKDQTEFSSRVKIIEDDFNEIEYHIPKDTKFDLILSDMAPEFSGDSQLDRGRTHKLNLLTLDYCQKYLKKGGDLVFKTFEGEDIVYVRNKAKELFKEVKDFKPESSQKKSSEIFVVCRNLKN